MKLEYTAQAFLGLEEALEFNAPTVSYEKLMKIRNSILDKAESLINEPLMGQKEPFLEHLNLDHRRIIQSHYKIIYRVVEQTIYITDIFDSRQDPDKMNR